MTCKDGIIGFIIGDAIGVPIEFVPREKLQKNKIVDMIDSQDYGMPKGCWSDDSSMVIATIDSIIKNNGKINYDDIMNNFLLWINEGKFTPEDTCFDVGRTTLKAIRNYEGNRINNKKVVAFNCGMDKENNNGNGSLMRILPVAYYSYFNRLEYVDIYDIVSKISSLTHRHPISIMGCYIYVLYVICLLQGKNKKDSYDFIKNFNYNKYFDSNTIGKYCRLLKGNISALNINDILSTGYVIDTLEAVFWSFLNSESFESSIICAINLGDDTDTIGALVGALSGIYYKYNSFPERWIKEVKKIDYLYNLCDRFDEVLKN